ncbi:MAG: cyclic nucleotide-binding domain-containing protein [Lentisphaeraceae bacterium]|nr:cyclic nucleotide-binding domain-containing protein [Lentisphaeraceae bacterium]
MAVEHIEDLNLPSVDFNAGDVILEEGITSSKIYILQSGKVRVVAKGEEICTIDVKGAVFGETSVLLGHETSAKVEAVGESSFLLIDDAANYLKSQPELIYNIAMILAGRIVNMNQLFVEMRGELGNKGMSKIKKKLYGLMIMTNNFFDRDVMHPFKAADSNTEESEEDKQD